jgi:hypothetical protein
MIARDHVHAASLTPRLGYPDRGTPIGGLTGLPRRVPSGPVQSGGRTDLGVFGRGPEGRRGPVRAGASRVDAPWAKLIAPSGALSEAGVIERLQRQASVRATAEAAHPGSP